MKTKLSTWTKRDMPSLEGRIAIVTGGATGIGYEVTLALAEAGAEVIIASRNKTKGQESAAQINKICHSEKVSYESLDLGSLKDIQSFCVKFNGRKIPLDILVNNAGIASLSGRELTKDGFEAQMGVNHLGPFALTEQLMPSLLKSSFPARVVTVSSQLHRYGWITFQDLQSENMLCSWFPSFPYCKSKLASLIFAFELNKKSIENGWGIISMAIHPGVVNTDILFVDEGANWASRYFYTFLQKCFLNIVCHSAVDGAVPILFAATAPEAEGGQYYSVDGYFENNGKLSKGFVHSFARDSATAEKLWKDSEKLTGCLWKYN